MTHTSRKPGALLMHPVSIPATLPQPVVDGHIMLAI